MNSVEHEEKRKRDLFENITIMHMLCLFIMLFALVISRNLFAENVFPFINYEALLFLAGCLVSFALVNLYNRSYYYRVDENGLNWLEISYIGYPLLISIIVFYMSQNSSIAYPEIMLLLPVIIAASIGGQLLGLTMAAMCGGILFFFGYFEQGKMIYGIFESHLIFLGIMLVVGWFIGSQTDSEKEQ